MPATPVHHTPTTDAAWDGPAAEKALDTPLTKTVGDDEFAWQDPDGDLTTKAGWKLPHHQVSSDGTPGAANVRACQSIVSILNGGMGGADIPDGDRQGVFDHVAAHLKDAKVDVPELKSADGPTAKRRKPRHRRGLAPGREVRLRRAAVTEVRAATDDQSGDIVITGMPIVYNTPYQVNDLFGSFSEVMHPGVVTNSLAQGADVRLLFNHDGLPLARSVSNTLTLADTPTGLTITANLDPRQQLANDLAVAIERGDVSQMSCGFIVEADSWSGDWPDDEQRDIYAIDLMDVSAVTYPASETTTINVASRMMASVPVESRARVRRMWTIARELREGKVLSAANAEALQQALAALHQADDNLAAATDGLVSTIKTDVSSALDEAQGAVSGVLGQSDPDSDDLDNTGSEETDDNPDGTDPDPSGAGDSTGDMSGSRSAVRVELELLAMKRHATL